MLGMGIAITLAVAALTYDNLRSMLRVIHDAKRAELRQYTETILVNVALTKGVRRFWRVGGNIVCLPTRFGYKK